MNTRRCENISRPPEPRGTMAQRKSNIQAFMGLEFGFCVSAIGLDDAPASGQDRSQAAGGRKIDLGLNTQTQHLRLSWKPTRVSDVQDPRSAGGTLIRGLARSAPPASCCTNPTLSPFINASGETLTKF